MGVLGGLSLLLMERLPQGLVVQRLGDRTLHLGDAQLLWLLLGAGVLGIAAISIRSVRWLREYRYTWAALGIALLAAVFLLGDEVNGARLSVRLGPFSGQPSELLKVILVVFLAAYLADNRPILASTSTRLGPIALPPLPYLLPMLAMWGIAVAMVIVQRDLGAALLLFSVFLALLYIATRRGSYVVLGLLLFAAGAWLLYGQLAHVRTRVDIWLDPWTDPLGAGYQVIQALYAFGRGGILGTGLGAGLPSIGNVPAIPLVHTDFAFAALGEELGLMGALAIGACYLVLAERGLRIAARAPDEFQALLAAGLTLVVVLQAASHHGRQPAPRATHGRDPTVRQLWRVLAAHQRTGRRACSSPSATAGRSVGVPAPRVPHRPFGGRLMPAPGIGSGLLRVGMVICVAYALIAVGAGCPAGGPGRPADPRPAQSSPAGGRAVGTARTHPGRPRRGRCRQRATPGWRSPSPIPAPGDGAHHGLQESAVRDRRPGTDLRSTARWSRPADAGW